MKFQIGQFQDGGKTGFRYTVHFSFIVTYMKCQAVIRFNKVYGGNCLEEKTKKCGF